MNSLDKVSLALEHSDCLVVKDDIGVTYVNNICNNSVREISWGLHDWFNFVGISLVLIVIIIIFAGLIGVAVSFIKEELF